MTVRARWWPALLAVAVVGGVLLWRSSSSDGPAALQQQDVHKIVDGTVSKAVKDLRASPPRSVDVFRVISPSLVIIKSQGAGSPEDEGLGSGVVVNDQGSILTANHVVDGAGSIEVIFADGTRATAFVASADPDNDIAVLGTDRLPEVVVPAVLGGRVQVGDEAIVAGHPLGFVDSLSDGVISGLDRSIPRKGGGTLDRLIQFDAAVNPGSSGGPLLDRNGQVVGIVTALADSSSSSGAPNFSGVGFAVPIGTAGGAAGAPPR